jgi:fatty acid desaturase
MQVHAQPTMTAREGRTLWLSMRKEVDAGRLAEPNLGDTLLKLAAVIALLGVALCTAWSGASPPWALAAAYVALALVLAQFAFIGHDAGHAAVSRRASINRALGQASMTLVTGLAFDEWIGRHRAHHRFCQVESSDPDMAVDIVVSLTERSRRRKGVAGRLLTRYQAGLVWWLSLLFGHSQRHLSQWAVLSAPRRYSLDALMLCLHFGLWFVLPCAILDVPVRLALLAYLVPLTILGPYLAAIFWVNHVGMPLVSEPQRFSFFEHQTITSRTIVIPPGIRWLFGGLNFQIEHHLFPQVPARRLPAVERIVRRHFDHNAIAYHGVSWPEAVAAVASHLRRVARAA